MPDTPDLAPAFVLLGSVAGVAGLATPILWRVLRQKARWLRLLASTLGCVGLAGLIGLGLEASNPSRYEMVTVFALVTSLLLQGLILPLLIVLSRKS